MSGRYRNTFFSLITALGGAAFLFHVRSLQPLLSVCALLYSVLLVFFLLRRRDRRLLDILLPFSAGLLAFVLRLFYWDGIDLAERLNHLLLLSLLFSLLLLVRKSRLLQRGAAMFNRQPLRRRLIQIFVVLEIFFILAAVLLTGKNVTLIGDEPHYIIISQSIVRDFDLNVADQYYQKQYREFLYIGVLGIHGYYGKWDLNFEGAAPAEAGTEGKKKGSYIYSIHLPGVSVTLAPLLLLKLSPSLLYILSRAFLGLFGAALAVLIYLMTLKLWERPRLALFATALYSLTVPVFFYSIHIYPEIQVTAMVMGALYLLLFSRRKNNWTVLAAGLLFSLLLFWGVKYAIFMYLFSGGFFVYFLFKKRYRQALLLIVFPVLSQALFLLYLYSAYGNFSPMSIYMNAGQKKNFLLMITKVITFKMRLETLLDYFFDQKDGLLLYNPFYFFAFPGFILALKKFKKFRLHLLISIPAAFFILNYAFLTHRGGYCPQARPLAPVSWMLLLFGVIYFLESENEFFKKIYKYIPLYSLGVVIFQVFHPFTLYQATTANAPARPGLLFQQWSNINIYLPDLLSSFVKVKTNHRYLPNIVILLLFAVLVVLALLPMRRKRLGILFPAAFALPFALFVLFPRVPVYNPTLVENDKALPHRIYGVSSFPTRTAERLFECTAPGRYRYTVSTFTPAAYFVFEFENRGETPAAVALSNFDRSIKTDMLDPLKKHRWVIPAPQYKRLRRLYYYQFTLDVRAPAQGPLSLTIQLYPAKRPD